MKVIKMLRVRSLTSVLVFVTVLLTATLAFQYYRAATFPPLGVECFDQFMSVVQNGYADPELDLPPFVLDHVSSFRCASKKGYEQYEISGIDSAGHTFYVHHIGGGMAASGADSVLDHCYKSDGKVIKSISLTGRAGVPGQGSCEFNTGLPADPETTYSYSSRL